jgi:hypothetical protein
MQQGQMRLSHDIAFLLSPSPAQTIQNHGVVPSCIWSADPASGVFSPWPRPASLRCVSGAWLTADFDSPFYSAQPLKASVQTSKDAAVSAQCNNIKICRGWKMEKGKGKRENKLCDTRHPPMGNQALKMVDLSQVPEKGARDRAS